MNLPIDLVPASRPPVFRWRQLVNSPIGPRSVEHEGQLQASVEDAIISLIGIAKQLSKECAELKGLRVHIAEDHAAILNKRIEERTAERDKLQAFKDWVHNYLDNHKIPVSPPGKHGAEGCRIGDRMDWLFAEMDKLREQVKHLSERLVEARGKR